jgi:arylsulfatase
MASDRPNLILIMCDQMRHDCAGFAGSRLVQTPNLDQLAHSGVVCEQTYCASPVCSPARASWLSGLYPHATGQLVNAGPTTTKTPWSQMRADCVTLGDLFNASGYHCGISGPWHLGDDHRPQHGFESFWRTYRYQGNDNPDRFYDYLEREGVSNIYTDKDRFVDPGYHMPYATLEDPRQQRTTWTIDQGIEFIEGADDDPYFLFLSVKDPHPLIAVAPELVALYPVDDIPLPTTWGDPLEGKPASQHLGTGRLQADVDEVEFRRMMAHYYALVTHIDAQVGRLVRRLKELDQRHNTVIAFMSDHGEMLGDHGFTTKVVLYEGSVRVPCVLSWLAGIPAGQRMRTPLGGVDLMPTLAELCGVEVEAESIDGRSVAAAIRGAEEPEEVAVFAEISSWQAITGKTQAPEELAAHVMVRDRRWKYVWNRTDEDELYDLEGDPDEMENLAGDSAQQQRVQELRQLVGDMLQRTVPGPYEWFAASV